jgi:NADPH2:quinone reductase
MKAIVCEEYGPIENLRFKDVDEPTVGAHEILIDVRAIGVNYPDGLVVQGLYQARPETPFIPGCESAGVVLEVGNEVSGFEVGDRVASFTTKNGVYAQKLVVDAHVAIKIPDAMSFSDGANIICAHGTAHHALKHRAALKSGETVLVLGAAGGTGIAAIQIAKTMGAKVIAAASTAEKLEIAKSNGADHLINYSDQDLKAALKEITGGKGVDVVFDSVGGNMFDTCSRSMARNGRLLVIGFASGEIPKLSVNLTLVKEYAVVGVFFGSFCVHQPKDYAENMAELFEWYEQGKVGVVIDEELPLSEAVNALQKIMDRKVKGKMVLLP